MVANLCDPRMYMQGELEIVFRLFVFTIHFRVNFKFIS